MASRPESPLKARPLRNPGQSLDEEIDALLNDKLLGSLLYPLVLWMFAGLQMFLERQHVRNMSVWLAIAAAIMTIWSGFRIVKLRKQVRALRLGRDGERAVGQFLELLREDGARIFHDVPGESFNLDHVVISERGIFAVETKTRYKPSRDARVSLRDGELVVAGHKPDRDPIKQVQAQMTWLSRVLEDSTGKRFAVRGALVFPGWFVDSALKNAFNKIWVLEPKALPSFIEGEEVCLSPQDVSLAAFHLSRFIRSQAD